jgi:hypothetical protein
LAGLSLVPLLVKKNTVFLNKINQRLSSRIQSIISEMDLARPNDGVAGLRTQIILAPKRRLQAGNTFD